MVNVVGLDQAEKARGATQRGTLSAYAFLMRNFMMIPKIFGKRASPDANGSYGRGYGCWSAKIIFCKNTGKFLCKTSLIAKFDAEY